MKINYNYFLTSILVVFFVSAGAAQIRLTNPGFEDTPADATVPKTWLPCEEDTTPDILPGFWGEYEESYQGETYIGLICRENSTFEAIGQKLSGVLKKGECYEMSIYLAKGSTYAGYNKALKLRVWLGKNVCQKSQVIFISKEVEHSAWKKYQIEFTPDEDYQYFRIEAFYKDGNFSYKGNILIDNISNIIPCKRV